MLKRELYLEKIRGFYNVCDLVKILAGIRRCGKSVILEQIIEEIRGNGVEDNHIIHVNFEFVENFYLKDYNKLNSYIKENTKDDKIYYLFFDEIQNVDNFEYVINSLRATKKYSIFITGSNSKLLSSELSTSLSGRYVVFNIYPFCYREVLALFNVNHNMDTFNDFIKWGGLPNRFMLDNINDIKNYLNGVFDSIILRDVVEKLNIRDTILLDLIIQYIVDTIGREFSAQNIMKYLKSLKLDVSTLTIYSYLDALCKAFLIKKVNRYDVSGKNVLRRLCKYYVTDLGIAQIKNHNKEISLNYALENIVYNELLVKGYDVYVGKTNKGEVDFVAIDNKKAIYIQVAVTAQYEDTKEREFGAFREIKDNYPKVVLTLDPGSFDVDGIKQINIVDFLLNDEFYLNYT